jgi:apolipoprotein D and lipocalin family protein
MVLRSLLSLLGVLLIGGCASGPPPRTADHVDLSRYAGTWYEIARITKSFESGCVAVTATYEPRPDGKITVTNRCRDGTLTGKERSITGTARVVDAPRNAQLKVTFFWPFEGDYWILRLNEDYTTAAVGSPDRKTLWILHRQPAMAPNEYAALLESLKADGFPVERLDRVPQLPP